MGRRRGERWGPRRIDLDLLLYDDQIIETPELTAAASPLHRGGLFGSAAEIAPTRVIPYSAHGGQLLGRLANHWPWCVGWRSLPWLVRDLPLMVTTITLLSVAAAASRTSGSEQPADKSSNVRKTNLVASTARAQAGVMLSGKQAGGQPKRCIRPRRPGEACSIYQQNGKDVMHMSGRQLLIDAGTKRGSPR
jgi:hypothetical protein